MFIIYLSRFIIMIFLNLKNHIYFLQHPIILLTISFQLQANHVKLYILVLILSHLLHVTILMFSILILMFLCCLAIQELIMHYSFQHLNYFLIPLFCYLNSLFQELTYFFLLRFINLTALSLILILILLKKLHLIHLLFSNSCSLKLAYLLNIIILDYYIFL